MDLDKNLCDTLLEQKLKILQMATGKQRLNLIQPSPVFAALELELPPVVIQKLIENGANTNSEILFPLSGEHETPLIIALYKRLSLDQPKV